MKAILSVPDEGYFERTWWRLFQIGVVRTKFDIYVLFSLPNVSEAHPVCSLLTPCVLISELNKLRQNGDINSCWSYDGRIFA